MDGTFNNLPCIPAPGTMYIHQLDGHIKGTILLILPYVNIGCYMHWSDLTELRNLIIIAASRPIYTIDNYT